jgi:hypothetical protein
MTAIICLFGLALVLVILFAVYVGSFVSNSQPSSRKQPDWFSSLDLSDIDVQQGHEPSQIEEPDWYERHNVPDIGVGQDYNRIQNELLDDDYRNG